MVGLNRRGPLEIDILHQQIKPIDDILFLLAFFVHYFTPSLTLRPLLPF